MTAFPPSLFAKVNFKAPDEYKQQFSNANCSVTISMGSDAQSNDKFGATLKSINKYFKSCTLMVCDSLQRHTLKINSEKNIDILHKEANQIGIKWVNIHKKYFGLLGIPFNVIHWDTWLCHDDFAKKRSLIDELYNTNQDYKQAVLETAQQFLLRYQRRDYLKNISDEKIIACSIDYLKEECAVMLLWADVGYDFEIYPSKRIKAMAATHHYLISQDYLKPVSLEIRSKKPTTSVLQPDIISA